MQQCLVLNICCIFVYISPWEYTFIGATQKMGWLSININPKL